MDISIAKCHPLGGGLLVHSNQFSVCGFMFPNPTATLECIDIKGQGSMVVVTVINLIYCIYRQDDTTGIVLL